MIWRRRLEAVALAAFLLAFAGAGKAPGRTSQDALSAMLPADDAAAGWFRDGEAQDFRGEDLYTYIDGGAEIYQEYGFRRVVVQDYKDAGGRSVNLELFEMASPEAAFGMFTFKRSGRGKVLSLGGGGELEDYYLNFWKGPYVVTLTGFDSDPATLAGLQALAGAVDAKIAGAADPPELLEALPTSGLRPGSVKYLKGPLGLNNIYSFATAKGLRFTAAIKGDYEDGSALIVLAYGTDVARAKAWIDLRTGLEASGKFEPMAGRTGEEPVYKDPKGRFAAFRSSASRLLVAIAPSAPAALNRVR
jgi:hypothetical protein